MCIRDSFTTLLEMINASEAREDDPDFQSPVDLMFERLEQKDPDHFAVRQYKKFLLSAGKTRSSILISCGARLAPFDIREVRELMEDDDCLLYTSRKPPEAVCRLPAAIPQTPPPAPPAGHALPSGKSRYP